MLQSNECTEARQLRDLAGNEITHLVILIDIGPRIFAELFDAERNALVGLIDFKHHRLDIIALLQDFRRMIDLAGP